MRKQTPFVAVLKLGGQGLVFLISLGSGKTAFKVNSQFGHS